MERNTMILNGNHYSAKSDRFGNVTILRKSDLKTVYLQGDEATEFMDNHRILDAIEYPSGPFATQEQHVDACLDAYSEVMS
jgi:hypothetical protein